MNEDQDFLSPQKEGAPVVEYKQIPISALEVELGDFDTFSIHEKNVVKDAGSHRVIHGGQCVRAIIIDGERVVPTNRFWSSIFARYNLGRSFFKYFAPGEIFKRLGEKHDKERIRVCIDKTNKNDDPRLLAVTGLSKPVLLYDDFQEVVQKVQKDSAVKYVNGILQSTHSPRVAGNTFNIGPDEFQNRFVVNTPIDGYGSTDVYLSLMRLLCENGMIGYANIFKTQLNLGRGDNNVRHTLQRALDAFNNEEGFAAMRDRAEAAQHSYASLRETQGLYKILLGLQGDQKLAETIKNKPGVNPKDLELGVGGTLLRIYEQMTGNPYEMFKVDPNSLTFRRTRTTPMACKVYDLINFATELSTHHVNARNGIALQAWVGSLLSQEYDLEGSCDVFNDFRDLFLSKSAKKE